MNYTKFRLYFVFRMLGLLGIYKKHCVTPLFSSQTNIRKLRLLLTEAKANVPFYNKFLPDFSNEEDIINSFRKLELTIEKSQVKNSNKKFIDSSKINHKTIFDIQSGLPNYLKFYRKDIVFEISTGGTTGSPLNFYMSKKRGVKFIMQFFAIAKHIGWKEEEPFMACVQGGMYQQTNFISKVLDLIGSPLFLFKELNKKTAADFADIFNKTKPRILFSSPSFLSQMAIMIKKNNIQITSCLKGIMSCGEVLFDSQRKIIEEIYKAKVCDIYASNELGIIGIECKKHNGFHILNENVFLENDPSSQIIATAFGSECQPFIKYKTGDIGTITFQECSCGVKGFKLTNLKGRIEEYIVDYQGNHIHASYIRKMLIEINKLYNNAIAIGQFVQNLDKSLFFKIQLNKLEKSDEIINCIKEELEEHFHLKSNGIVVDSLIQEKGKFRFYYREE